MVVELLLLFIICVSGTIFFFVIIEELNRYKHILKIQTLFNSTQNDNIYVPKDSRVKLNLFKKLEEKMLLANLRFLPCYFNIATIIFAVILGKLFSLYLLSAYGYIFGFIGAVFLAFIVLETLIAKRKRAFDHALAISISVLVKMMKNGIGFDQALKKAIDTSNSKILQELFAIYFKEKSTLGEKSAFESMKKYMHSKELDIFAMAILVGRSSGGKFSNTLEKVEQAILYRKKIQDKADVITREASISSYIVALIGVVLYFMLDFNFGGKITQYFFHSPFGRWQLLAIILWVFIGLVFNKMITKVQK